ncbi:MAG: outer membrane adhesin like protein, partial [uncultured bacterium]
CRVDLQGDGSIRFAPELNFNNLYPGQASFRYTVTDGISDPVTAVAFFDIEPVNDAPILQGERIAGAVEDNSFAFAMTDLLANDTDVEMASPYEEDTIAFAGVWGAGHGNISSDSGTIYYTPNANFCGVETFSYSVVDSYGAGSVVQSEIYVEPVNDYPVVQDEHGEAEDSVWNYYSIDGLLSNDFDVDGDRLTIHSPRVRVGDAEVQISGGDLMLKPAFREDRVIVNYTVSDGHGGEVESELDIMSIREHNFAPTFSGLYAIAWKNSYTVWFNFHAEDKNGGNTWSYDYGDIVAISASAPNVGQITDEGVTFKFKGDTSKASVVLTAVDQGGATGSIYINIAHLSKGDGNYIYSPVVLDLDGDGVELQGLAAGVGFDWNLDGEAEGTGWAGKDDGFLVYDYDHDRVVRYAGELALKEYDPGAATDLEGLRAFDTNRDGTFDTRDAEWNSFGVWQDKNSDGLTDEGEFAGLAELAISSLDLQSDENFREQDGNIVYGTTTYWKTDGTAGVLADVGLGGETLELTEVEDSAVIDVSAAAEPLGELLVESPRADSEPSVEQPAPSGLDMSAEPTALPAIAAPEEQKLEADSPCTSVGGEETSPGSSEMVLSFDDAEINRLCLQLISDMAGSSVDEPVVPAFAGLDIIVPEYVAAPAMEIEHDSLSIV